MHSINAFTKDYFKNNKTFPQKKISLCVSLYNIWSFSKILTIQYTHVLNEKKAEKVKHFSITVNYVGRQIIILLRAFLCN